MGIQNQDGALFFASGIDNSGLRNDAKEASSIISGFSSDVVKDSEKMKSSVDGVGSSLKSLAGGISMGMIGKEILDTTAKFEKFGIVLRNTLGKDAGNDSLDMIAQFAATTPFQLDEVTAAFIKMANQGFVPTREEMVKLGDLASSTGKSFDQLTEALLDAQTGQFERLKEFGIKASANGDKVTFSFKEQQTTVDNTNSAIQKYILSLGDLKGVAGANAKISDSLTGQISNLEDKLAMMFNTIGTANKGVLYETVGLGSTLIENYEAIGKVILSMVGIYGTYKTAVFAVNAVNALQKEIAVQQMLANIGNTGATITLTTAQGLEAVAASAASRAQAALNATMLANPYVATAVAVAALAAGVYYLATRTTEAEKAHESLNKTAQDTENAIGGEVIQVNTLFARLKAAKKGTEEYKQAKDAIFSQYGQYLSKLGSEETALNNIALAQKTITNEVINTARARAMSTATSDNANNLAKKQGDILAEAKKLIDDKFGKDSKQSIDLFAQTKSVIQNGGTLNSSFLKKFDETIYQQAGQFGGTTSYVENKLKNLLGETNKANRLYEEVNKDLQVRFAHGEVTNTSKPKAPVSETPAQLKARLSAEKKAAAAAKREQDAADKLALRENDGEYNAKQDLKGLLVDLQNKTASLLLKSQEDNLQNRLAEIDLEKKEEIQKITEKEVAIIDAYNKAHRGDKKFKPLSTAPGDIQASLNTIDPDQELGNKLGAEEVKVTNAYGEKKKEATKKWGDEIQDLAAKYADERVQIEHDYNKEIQDLESKGLIAEAMKAATDRDKKISIVSKGLIEETDLYKAATDEQLQISKETTEKLIADIKKRIEADKTLTEKDKKGLLDKVDSTQMVKETSTGNPFTNLINGLNQYKKAKEKLATEKGKVSEDDYVKLEDAANKALSKTAATAATALQATGSILGSVVDGLDSLGVLNEEQKKMANDVINMVGGAANIAQGLATGNPVAVIQGAVGVLTSAFSLFDSKTRNADKLIKKDAEAIKELQKAYDNLKDSVEKAFSVEKSGLIKDESSNLQKQNELIKEQIAAEQSKGKKTDQSKIDAYNEQIEANLKTIEENKTAAIEALTGTDVMSAIDSFAEAYADAWASGEGAAKKSTDVVRNLIKTALVDYMKSQLQPQVTGIMKAIADAMSDGTISKQEQAAIDVLTNALDAKAAQYKNALDPYLADSKSGTTGQLTAATTEATASQLVGLWTMTSMDIRSIKEYLLYGVGLEQVKSADVSGLVGNILDETKKIQNNTAKTAENTTGLIETLDSLKEELEDIKNNTKVNNSRG